MWIERDRKEKEEQNHRERLDPPDTPGRIVTDMITYNVTDRTVDDVVETVENVDTEENLFLTQSSNDFNVNLTDNVVTGGPSRPKFKMSGTIHFNV